MGTAGRNGMAVVTRHGSLVHWPNRQSFQPARTYCGREWIDIYTPDASLSSVTCTVCLGRLDGDTATPECDGRCTTPEDLGLMGTGVEIAYPDPECSLHGQLAGQ